MEYSSGVSFRRLNMCEYPRMVFIPCAPQTLRDWLLPEELAHLAAADHRAGACMQARRRRRRREHKIERGVEQRAMRRSSGS